MFPTVAFFENPKSLSVDRHRQGEVVFKCSYPLDENHVNSISWITPRSDVTASTLSEFNNTRSTLMLTGVKGSDAGRYICVADVAGIEVNSKAAVLTIICMSKFACHIFYFVYNVML